MRFLPARDDALLIECADLEEALAVYRSLRDDPVPGVAELVPGARTVLVAYRPRLVSAAAIAATVLGRGVDSVSSTGPTVGNPAGGRVVEIPVDYAGEDLAEVAALLGITPAEVIARHTTTEYTVGFTGFAPGFAYLVGDGTLDVPRRSTPRTRIPAGSVALAGRFSGVYPRASPGGWQIIGSTPSVMWDLARDRPALLEPGDCVRFVQRASAPSASPAPNFTAMVDATGVAPPALAKPEVAHAVEVITPGPLTLVQDLGRPGLSAMGVPASGAADPVSLRAANRLVGNGVGLACLELTLGGLALVARGTRVLAVTGAGVDLEITRSDGAVMDAPFGAPFVLDDGDILTVGVATDAPAPISGLRSYLAVRGGFDVAPVLGSVSTDVLSGIGPDPVVAGTVLPVRTPLTGLSAVEVEEIAATVPPTVLDVVLGPRDDWFTAEAVAALTTQVWAVSANSNRVGLRLEGEPLARRVSGELPSEGTVAGAIQVPSDGNPVLFLTDHPVTGGYPVIAAVASYHLARAGQLAPGSPIRLRVVPSGAVVMDRTAMDAGVQDRN